MNSNPRLLNNIGETAIKTFNTNNKINSKITNGNDIQKETIQQVGLYGFNIEADRFKRINATNQGVLEVENSLENKRGFGQVLLTSAGGTAVKADTDCTVQEDPEHREGWNLTNAIAGTKFNLYYFNGTQEIVTLGSVASIYARAFINNNAETQSIPFFHIYTKPTGIGDAGPFYHSKIDYIYNSDNTIGIGEECIFYGIGSPTTSFSNRRIQFNNKVVTGDGADDEEILYMVFSSDSGATQDALNVTTNLLGFDTGTGILNRNFHLISESSLTGGATEAMQQLQLDQETFLRATQNLDFTVSAGSNNTSGGINMSPAGNPTYRQVVIFGETDNVTDFDMYIQFSNDNTNWYTGGYNEIIQLNVDPLDPSKATFYKLIDSPPQWIRLLKLNSTGSTENLIVKSSRIN